MTHSALTPRFARLILGLGVLNVGCHYDKEIKLNFKANSEAAILATVETTAYATFTQDGGGGLSGLYKDDSGVATLDVAAGKKGVTSSDVFGWNIPTGVGVSGTYGTPYKADVLVYANGQVLDGSRSGDNNVSVDDGSTINVYVYAGNPPTASISVSPPSPSVSPGSGVLNAVIDPVMKLLQPILNP